MSVIYVSLVVVAVVLWVVAHQATRDNWGQAELSEFVGFFVGLPWTLVYGMLTGGAGQEACAWFGVLINCAILGALLLIAWKWELVGGIALAATGLVLSIPVFALNYRRTHSIGVSLGIILMITIPFVVVGVLFIESHYLKKKSRPAT